MRIAPLFVTALTALAAQGKDLPPRPKGPGLALTSCRLEGAPVAAQCGTLTVPEDRANPAGRQIKLRIAVFPALARAPENDALFLLAGGPGQAATEAFGPLIGALQRARRKRDLVLVDQRGTGASNPLDCAHDEKNARLSERLSSSAFPLEELQKCLKGYDADPRFYTTSIAMQDLDDVRAALGYEQVNLWGGSYGTRAALVYVREHGEHVRSVILDGVAPLTMRVPLYFARDAERALQLLFVACAKESACAAAYPELRARFDALVVRLEKDPVKITVADPLTGEPQEVVINRELFVRLLGGVLYIPELAVLMPLTIDRATKNDFASFVAQAATLSRGFAKGMSLGMMLSVLCAEDLPLMPTQEIEALSKGTFLGPALIQEYARACSVWPRGTLPAGFHEPVHTDKPVLLLSGELDPVTPPAWAEEAKKTLPNSLHAIAPGVGHGVTSVGCAPLLVARFLDQASVKGLYEACLAKAKRPPFFVSFAGPTP